VIYEAHVRGLTLRNRGVADGMRGTYAGLASPAVLRHLAGLGVTAVELLPVHEHVDERSLVDRGLGDYWGYNSLSYFAPDCRYASSRAPLHAVRDFKAMVRALHAAGIGVILDVVFNHTAESGSDGPWINFRGIANEVFYLLDPRDRRRYLDFTGCGNTVNCNHPQMTAFIVHCLEYWVEEMHVDGFRFDLASVFARGDHGAVLANPPLPWNIELSRTLAGLPLIAEAWDAAGLYQLGAFPGSSWAEWNGAYRDTMRRFVRGDPGMLGAVASRIAGSSDLYARGGRRPCNSINFITCHDGFTLADLVSYERKHNEANGEGNRDGSTDNLSRNCGVEGPTRDAAILSRRHRQARNFVAVLMLSRGVPMLLSGDEVLSTQSGNNNAYCQDNPLSWFDWTRVGSQREMLRFTRELIALRRRHPSLTVNRFYTGGSVVGRGLPDICWHGARLKQPSWDDPGARVLAFTVTGIAPGEADIHAVLNLSDEAIEAELPLLPGRRWHLAVDTAAEAPGDVAAPPAQRLLTGHVHRVSSRSVVILEARAQL
ncbi:MAG TPA: glycogen debranching protein GlgX, partial [Steroidobacteraceae bacterium]|nr:glycogen debranching protein GlgX [Steroidobacteraceae bacterium]